MSDTPPPETGTPGADPLRALQEKLAAVEKERDTYLALAQRAQADFENYQQRQRRDAAAERPFLVAPLARDLLPALDNLDRALASAQQSGDGGTLAQGVSMVRNQLLDILRRHGITPIEALGVPFDYNFHEAVLEQPTKDAAPNTVVQVLEQGYKIQDRVLRPARVAVAVAPKE
jgi:molecular chaperone GrpE